MSFRLSKARASLEFRVIVFAFCNSHERWICLSSELNLPADAVIKGVAAELEKNEKFKPPAWYGTVKSSASGERLPESPKLWYTRVAAVLRTVALRGPVGVQRLRHKYGGRKEHTRSRAHHVLGSGKTLRVAFQQLESAGYVAKSEKGGRVITAAGHSLLDKAVKA